MKEQTIITNCKQSKEKLDSRLYTTWNKINSTVNWGCCTYLYKKYQQPTTLVDFYNNYINDSDYNIVIDNPKEFGRDRDYIHQYAEYLKEIDDDKEEIDTYYWYIIYKLIYCTFYGCQYEGKAKEIITEKGYIAETPTIEDDAKFGIDLKVYNQNHKHLCNVQVKPVTFFYGNGSTITNRRVYDYKKTQTAEVKYGVPTYYMVYNKDKDEFAMNKNNKYLFKFTDIVQLNGYVN